MDDLDRSIREDIERDPAYADLLRESRAELELGLEIARLRQERGWSQRELARRAGMPQSAIARLEKAGRTPTATTLWQIAKALDARIEFGPDYSVRIIDNQMHPPQTAGAVSRAMVAAFRESVRTHRVWQAAISIPSSVHRAASHQVPPLSVHAPSTYYEQRTLSAMHEDTPLTRALVSVG